MHPPPNTATPLLAARPASSLVSCTCATHRYVVDLSRTAGLVRLGVWPHRQAESSCLCTPAHSHSLPHSLAAMLVLLALNNIRTVLVTLGSLQMFAVVLAWFVLLLPIFTVANEPSVRMIKSHQHHHHHHHCTALPAIRIASHRFAHQCTDPTCCCGVVCLHASGG